MCGIDDDDDDESGGCDLRILERTIPRRLSGSEAARQRRRRISDRTRDLERLMPWTKKMDIAAMLGEAYKYIEFLAAQVQVLRSMPPPPPNQNHECSNFGGEFGRLELMNREQLLHVLMNSPISQTTLCSRKLCLCSIEQFESLMTAAMNKNHLSR
ncbi:hypothetical protein Sjap_025360 [Stephania japonica]|uniref:BHLH domain-containing protein n=1 Tax=Stephania japonica TaxID=461633 RepID=A0AAP0E1K4_9MAGN